MIEDIKTIDKIYDIYINTTYYISHLKSNSEIIYKDFIKLCKNDIDVHFELLLINFLNRYTNLFDDNLYNILIGLCKSDDKSNHYIALELIHQVYCDNKWKRII